ncbi:MAG: hypothetical protein KKG64_00655 [Firmicutes bacterium]|nr:hypothetical protein [Bacillota bacterium]
MEQPSPMEAPSTTTYTASIEISDVPKVSGSVTFEVSELNFSYGHQAYSEIFDITFLYQCNGSDCSYRNGMTYNKGTFLVDLTNNMSTAGSFVNNSYVYTRFSSTTGIWKNVLFGTSYHTHIYY